MKNFFSVLAIVMTVVLMSSCSSDSPKTVAEKSMACIVDGDYKGYVEYIYFNDGGDAKKLQRDKDGTAALIGEKLDKTLHQKKGFKHYAVLSEEVQDTVATVKTKIVYGNGEIEEDVLNMKKDKHGDWKIDMGK